MLTANKRKKFSPGEKVRLLRLHLVEKVPVTTCAAYWMALVAAAGEAPKVQRKAS